MKYIVLIACLFCACTLQKRLDKSYNLIAVDNAPTPRNKQILLNKCQTTFPLDATVITPGTETVKIETIHGNTDSLIQIIKELLQRNCPEAINVDSLTQVIVSGIKPIQVKETRTIHDTIDRGDTYAVRNVLAQKQELEKEKQAIEKKVDLLENTIELKEQQLKSSQGNNRLFLIGYGIIILLYIAKIHFTKRLF